MKNKRVLVTGGFGFIGSHLVEKLVSLGADVDILDKSRKRQCLGNKVAIIKEDITSVFELKKYDVVFHLAAFTDMKKANKDSKKVFDVNTYGTLNLLNACKGKVKKFVYLNTLGVYGNTKHLPMNEEQLAVPTELYAASKLAGETFVLAFGSAYNMFNISVRSFNAYGPRQNENFVIPSIIKQCFKKKIVKLGNLKSTRDFVFVEDIVDALILIAEKGKMNGIYNVGTGIETSIGDLTKKIIKVTNKKINLKSIKNKKRSINIDVKRSVADINKIRKLGWKPKTSLDEGLKLTVKYYENETR